MSWAIGIKEWFDRTFRPPPPPPVPDPITIAGIYTVCDRLGLGKSVRWPLDGRQMLVAMTSGRDAIYAYTDWKPASGVDWDWHIFTFVRYVEPGEAVDLPRYC
jgi:hypothetical protein